MQSEAKHCAWCSEVFYSDRANKIYCCRECSVKAADKRKSDNVKKRRTKVEEKRNLSIGEIAKKAMEEHMTYGKYVQKYGIKQKREGG